MSSRRLLHKTLISLVVVVVALFLGDCDAKTSPNCDSSCGNIPNISRPFRVKGYPENCGKKEYELECEHNRLVYTLFSSAKYYVQAINYNNYTIRLVDVGLQQGNCSSLPLYSLSDLDFTTDDPKPYSLLMSSSYDGIYGTYDPIPWEMAVAAWVDCEKPVKKYPSFTDSRCIGKAASSYSLSSGEKRHYPYFLFGNLSLSDVEDHCKIDEIVMTTLRLPPGEIETNISFSDFHSRLEFGFELSWLSFLCEKCQGQDLCEIGSNYSTVTCYSRSCKSFRCETKSKHGETKSPLVTDLVPPGIFLFAVLVIATYFACRSSYLKKEDQVKVERFLENYRALKPTRYTYAEIKKITQNFKDKLGQGGYGTVYKGELSIDVPIAAKILNNFTGNGDDFINEVGTIGTIHHVNVVRLVGYCADGYEKALVYEYLPNDSLDKFISSDHKKASLGWEKLQDIALGIAKGIEYLHQGCDQRILHFDIKPHNILLDKNFIPKVSDFGLAKLCSKDQSDVSMTAARGTVGYIAPEVFSRNFGNVSHKSDVYSFGMLLLEMVGGRKKNIDVRKADNSEEVYFPEWIYNRLNRDELNDSEVEEGGDGKIIKKLTIVGLWCIQWYPGDRPSMKTVVQMLEGDGDTLAMPPNPFSTTNRSTTRGKMEERPFSSMLEIISESD